MRRPFAWSHSALKSYEMCPKKHWHTRIKKDFQEDWGDATSYGDEVHKAMDVRLKHKKELPLGMRHLEEYALSIEKAPGELYTEQRLALNAEFQPTGYFDNDVWVRGQLDVAKVRGSRCVVFDYKTGRRRDDFDQLALMAALMLCHEPKLEVVATAFIWIKDKAVVPRKYRRDELAAIWNTFLPRVNRMELAFKTDDWPAKQNGLCRKHCPVTTCVFHGGGNGSGT